jgi:hypothetical protein
MDKRLVFAWLIIFAITFVLLMTGISTAVVNTYTETEDAGVREVDNWDVSKLAGPDATGMYTVSMRTTVPLIHNGGETLMFYTYHSDVSVYVNNKKIYSNTLKQGTGKFEPVLADAWNSFALTKGYQGQWIEVVMKSYYPNSLEMTPTFELGDKFSIIMKELKESALSYLLSALLFICGIFMTIYSFSTGKNRENGWSMMYLGLFSAFISVWFIVNIPLTGIFTGNTIPLSYTSYLILGTLPLPFVLFERSIVRIKHIFVWDILAVGILLENVIIVALQVFDIMDLKESLAYVHYMIGVTIFAIIIIGICSIIKNGFKTMKKVNKANVTCAIITAISVGADMFSYYLNADMGREYIFTKIAMLVFVVVLAYISMAVSVELMEIGKTAQKFEQMAYMDEMTGVNSRASYMEMSRKLDLSSASYTVFMFDLNNLKSVMIPLDIMQEMNI